MQLHGHDIGVCSWSLQPQGMADLVDKVRQTGVQHVQLALADLLPLDDKRKHQELGHLRGSGIKLTGAMMSFAGEDYSSIAAIRRTGGFVPDAEWPLRQRLTEQGAKLAAELGVKHITAHVGFIPPAGDPNYAAAVARIRSIAQTFAAHGVALLMETGQEPADELLEFLQHLNSHNVHINFDPANMILYGAGDPIAALRTLGRHVRHVHVKDATPSARPGIDWGEEVPFGTGEVGPARFLAALKEIGYTGPLAIEREAGTQRVADVKAAVEALRTATAG